MSTFFFMVPIFTMIAVVIDISEKLDNFLDKKIPFKSIFFDYYLQFIPSINGLLWPLYTLISVIFFTSRMAFNSELIAIIGSGVSFNKILRPYLIGAFILAGLHLFGSHIFVPLCNKKRVAFENKYIWFNNRKNKSDDAHLFIGNDTKVYMKRYNAEDSSIIDFSIERFKEGKLAWRLNAARADWQPFRRDWKLTQYTLREIDGMNEKMTIGNGRDTIISWLSATFKPGDIERRDNLNLTMTTPELLRFIKKERTRGAGGYGYFEVELQRRTADAFTCIILTLIGLSLAGRRVRGGMGLHLAFGALIGALFIMFTKFSATLCINAGLPAYIGIWIPNMIFGLLAAILMRTAQK
jgi:lipopolysaccharide export system permease protein